MTSPSLAHRTAPTPPSHRCRSAAPSEPDRVRRATASAVNRAIDRDTERSIIRHAALSEDRIRQRIRELDEEWDVERVLALHASALGLTGLALGLSGQRKWLLLPGVVMGFLCLHATQGWCPPLPLIRRLGVRTRSEIDREKYTLLSLLEAGDGEG